MSFIDEINDPVVKLNLTDKIPALLIGAYRASGKASKQYLDEILTEKQHQNKSPIIDTFTERFLSHGYPMHKDFLVKNKICVNDNDAETENLLYDLHEEYLEKCNEIYSNKPNLSGEMLLIQLDSNILTQLGHKTMLEKIENQTVTTTEK